MPEMMNALKTIDGQPPPGYELIGETRVDIILDRG